MLTAFIRVFRTPDLRKKVLFTIFILAVFRLGQQLPTPGVSQSALTTCANLSKSSGVFQLINLFSGDSITRLAVFALGIMPYIIATTIIQLLATVIPRLETLRQEGQTGQAKMTQYSRYLTIGLAILQSTGIIALARSGELLGTTCPKPLIPNPSIFTISTMVVIMTAGTAVIMWLGELVTDRGIGNGMSVMIFTQIIAVVPSQLLNVYRDKGGPTFAIVMIMAVALVAFIALMEQAQRRIPIQYAKRMVGRRMYGGTSTYIPLKINQAGVMPVIFASSLLYIPQLVAQLFGTKVDGTLADTGWSGWVNTNLVFGDKPAYAVSYFVLLVFFTYFYVSITFNPTEVADNMKRSGGFIPGIRPGGPTAGYLSHVLSRLTAAGSLYLACIALIPLVAVGLLDANQQFPLGGTSILIMVGVGLDTVKQLESQLQQRNYEGFLR
jgi:preprotein translocase subunit SecY